MIAAWMLYCLGWSIAALLAAEVIERGCLRARLPVRWIWLGAMAGSVLGPAAQFVRGSASQQFRDPYSPVAVAPAARRAARTTSAPIEAARDGWRLAFHDTGALNLPLGAIWLAFAAVGAGRVLRDYLRLQRRRRDWQPALVDGVEVLVSDDAGPAVIGVRRPEIVMPRWVLELEWNDRALLLRHELEHQRSGDGRLIAFAEIAASLLAWNPIMHWEARRLRAAIELDCDARVLRALPDPRRYGTLMLDLAQRASTSAFRPLVAVGWTGNQLERRLRAMTNRAGARRAPLVAASIVALVTMALVVVGPVPSSRVLAQGRDTAAFHAEVLARARRIRRDTVKFRRFRESLPANSFIWFEGPSYWGVRLENWKRTPLTRDALAPVAVRAARLVLQLDTIAARAKVIRVDFVDYTPRIATFTWARDDVTRHPDRYTFSLK